MSVRDETIARLASPASPTACAAETSSFAFSLDSIHTDTLASKDEPIAKPVSAPRLCPCLLFFLLSLLLPFLFSLRLSLLLCAHLL